MSSRDRVDRIDSQFGTESDRTDIWRGLSLFLSTDSYLNLGYSGRFQSHLIGDPQERLVERVVDRLAASRPDPRAERLLDVGCGRGAPVRYAANRWGFDAVGIDLGSDNLALAKANSSSGEIDHGSEFVLADATYMPFDRNAFSAAMSIDAIVYVPDRSAVYAQLDRVVGPGGTVVVTDVLRRQTDLIERADLDRFSRAWGMPPPEPIDSYVTAIEQTALEIASIERLTDASLGTVRPWARLFLTVADGPIGPVLRRALMHYRMDPDTVIEQVRAAYRVLPALEHVLLTIDR
ncbi:class I SAM-dependent methyltransferase [Halovivax gelatinilyticus]|uniref:class I SAM-dependent methyltransferase n=1 Tax=Halovivax gelatinilyticus TaxID=2961597 RepID=UPI0020CA5FE5|nr:class I SAM-dependent methyltransferase [Halovivax gelatinilyticus]